MAALPQADIELISYFAFMMGESANAKAAKARVKTTIKTRIFFIRFHLLAIL